MKRILVRFALVSVGIMSIGIMASATQAGPVVRFNLDYSVTDSSGPIDYFDVELFDTAAPITVANFLKYVNNGLYNNTIIHRDAKDFVMQGGGFTPEFSGTIPTALNPITSYGAIQNEFSPTRSNVRGTIAMAKLGNNPNSATNQWFVNLGDNSANLDNQNGGFTVFGQVIGKGMTLIDAVNSLPTYDVSNYFSNSAFTEVPLVNNGSAFVTVKSAAVVLPPTSSTGSLSGFVYVDTNHNGVMDGLDYAIADARVSIMQAGSNTPLATVYSAGDGSYHFNNLGVGTFSIKMQTPSDLPGQDNGNGQMLLDKDGKTILSVGTAGMALPNAYSDISLGDGQTRLNVNFAEAAYPVALISARILLNDYTGIPHATAVAVLGTNTIIGSILGFGNVLVGTPGNTTLTVTNLGGQGSALSGTLPGASGAFGPAGTSAFGPLDPGQGASQQYTYTPSVRGSNTQGITVTTNAGNLNLTLSGTGVAPIQAVDTSAANAGLVRIGTTGAASVTIKNTGDGNLSGMGAASNLNGTMASGSGKFSGSGGSVSLSDSAGQTFSFTYTPTAHTTDSTTIVTAFNNGSADGRNLAETVNANLSGRGVGPVFSSDLAPGSTLDFGTVPQADLKSLILNVSNASTDPNGGNTALTDLTLLNAEITGTDAGLFSIVGFTPGALLHESDLLSLEIAYNGTGAHGDRSAVLTFFTDEGAAIGASGNVFTYQISASLAPEPSSLVLLAIAGLFLGGLAWRRWAIGIG